MKADVKYRPRREPDENQREALSLMRGREAFALLMAMRTRKTKVVLDDFGELELSGKARDLLVIAPNGVIRTWDTAIRDDFSADLLERSEVLVWSSSYTEAKLRTLLPRFLDHEGPRVLLMNIEALSLTGGRARGLVIEFLRRNPKKTYVTIDESTCIKGRSAKRTRFVIDQVRPMAARRRILSGLATPRNLLDLFCQFYFLDPAILGHRHWSTFRAHVAFLKMEYFGGRQGVILIDQNQGIRGFREEAIEEVREKIAPYSFRVEFRPKSPSTFEIREVEMTGKQRKAYEELRAFATTALEGGGHVTATVVIAQIVRLHQVLCGHVIDENGVEHVIPENRTKALLEILREHNGKAIIWCSYGHDIEKVSRAIAQKHDPASFYIDDDGEERPLEPVFPNATVARFWGGNLKTRESEELRFRTDPECRFMVATPDAGGKGRTWDVADLAVFYSNRDSLELRDQAEMRTMGRDKERGVDNIDLVVPGTVDEKILYALRNKIDMASTINGDVWREWVV